MAIIKFIMINILKFVKFNITTITIIIITIIIITTSTFNLYPMLIKLTRLATKHYFSTILSTF